MSILEIRCPRCGSPDLESTANEEFSCKNCNTKFRILKYSQTAGHYMTTPSCPLCGEQVKFGPSYNCMNCERENICERDIRQVPRGTAAIKRYRKDGKFVFLDGRGNELYRSWNSRHIVVQHITYLCADCWEAYYES